MRKEKIIILLPIVSIILALNAPISRASIKSFFGLYPSIKKLQSKVSFVSPNSDEIIKLDNGMMFHFERPLPGEIIMEEMDDRKYYMGIDVANCLLTVEGLTLSIKNNSNQIQIIRWRESSISVNNYSGIPFLDGMNYIDANSPVTPDNILAPGQQILRDVHLPITYHTALGWRIKGELIPIGGTVDFILLLKILDASEKGKYYSMECPQIGVKE